MEIFEEIKELRNKIDEIEKKYSFMYDYKLISTILDRLGVNNMTIPRKDIENNESMYTCINEIDKVIVKKEGQE